MPSGRNLSVCEVHAAGYRFLRSIHFPIGALTVFVGANGAGRANLYRALQLLQAAASGMLAYELASKEGMASAMWAGRRRANQPAQIELATHFADSDVGPARLFSYEVAAGSTPPVPPGPHGAFPLEPQIKEELLTFHYRGRTIKLLERRGPVVFGRDAEGCRKEISRDLMTSETALGAFDEPQAFPEIHSVRRLMLGWRFYHSISTDPGSSLRPHGRRRSGCRAAAARGYAAKDRYQKKRRNLDRRVESNREFRIE